MSTPERPGEGAAQEEKQGDGSPQLPEARPRPSSDELDEALEILEAELPYRTDLPAQTGLSMGIVGMAAQRISGPVPSSGEMAGYKNVDPSLPERIMDGVDEERRHRHAMEKRAVHTDALVSVLGTCAGTLFVLAALAIAVYALSEGFTGVAIVAIIGSLSPVAIALVNRGRSGDGD